MGLENVLKLSLIVNMIDRITGPAAKVNSTVDEAIGKMDQWDAKFKGMTKQGTALVGIGGAMTAAALSPVKATKATQNALGELASLGVKDLKAVESAARDFSDQWAGTTKANFISAAYDIKSGIASLNDEGVAQMTELAALTGKATKATTATMTDLFATGYNIYKGYYSDLSDLEFGEMFSAGIARSVQAFKTDGSKMAESISTLGASATTANVPLEEQLSILGMLQATMGGSEAGTKYRAFLKSAAKAGDELGISFMDTNNQLLSMPEILDKLRGKYGETIDAAEKMELTKAFGTDEAVSLIDLLYTKTGDLKNNISDLSGAMGQGTGLAEGMATAINEMDPQQAIVVRQQIQNIKEDIGEAILPMFGQLLSKVQSVVSAVAGWVQDHQQLAGAIFVGLAAAGMLTMGIGAVMVVVGTFGRVAIATAKGVGMMRDGIHLARDALSGLKAHAIQAGTALRSMGSRGLTAAKSLGMGIVNLGKQAITAASTALPPLIASVWSFTTALLANPVTWIVIGVMALVAAIILLWQHWDQVTAAFSAGWAKIRGAAAAGLQAIQGAFDSIKSWIKEKIAWFGTAGERIMTTLTGGIKKMAMAPVNAVKGAFTKIRKLLPFSDAKEGPLSHLTLNGRKVMETISGGIDQSASTPAEAAQRAFGQLRQTTEQRVPKIGPIGFGNSKDQKDSKGGAEKTSRDVHIDKVILYVKPKDLEDLQQMKKLLTDLNDAENNYGSDTDDTEPGDVTA